jgi:hypothetical protein
MSQILEFLSQPWVGSSLGIFGIVAAVIFYLRSRRIARLSFQKDEVAIIGGSGAAFPEEVTISFAGAPVNRVTASRFVIWNSGNTTLSGSQIVQSDQLRLELKGKVNVLKIELLRVSRQVNAAWIKQREGAIGIVDVGFDYLDPSDGLAIEVLHSGGRSDLNFAGTLRGLPSGIKDYGRAPWYFDRRFRNLPFPFGHFLKTLIIFSLCVGLSATTLALLQPQLILWFPSLAEKEVSNPLEVRWLFVFIGVTYTALPLLILWLRRRRYPSCLEPASKSNSTEHDDGPNEDSADASSS